MILFLISFLLVFISSYFITSVIAPKKSILGVIYLFIIAFAQIVLIFEVLSIFSAIKQFWVLFANVVVFASSFYVWIKNSKPLWCVDCKDFRNRVANSLKLDKSLMWLYFAFCFFILVALVLCLLFPITSSDAYAYHVNRSLYWVLQGNLNHFDVPDIRNLCLPINSEILYSWVLLFVKKDVFLGFFSFVGYLLAMVSIYNILGFCGYCTRKKLWVIFILSSFASVLVQASSTETDIIIAGLLLSCVFLFWYGLRNNKLIPVFMASLAYALAVGTKTTAIIAIPGVGILMLGICFYLKKYKPLAYFLGFGVLNFLIFSSYNYILNFIDFHNFLTTPCFTVVSKNYYGFAGMIANFVKHMFLLIDFTGFRWSDYFGPSILALKNNILEFFHVGYIPNGLYSTNYATNRSLLEPLMGTGVLGLLVFIPCLIGSLLKPIFKFRTKKTWFTFIFAVVFIVNILVMSYLLSYMSFSVRFIMSYIVLSAPILVYSYLSNKNPLKYIIILFSLFYLLCISTHLWARPFIRLGPIFKVNSSITYLRYIAHCKDFEAVPMYTNDSCVLRDNLRKKFPKDKNLLIFIDASGNFYTLKALEFEGYKVDIKRLEDVNNIDFNKYDLVIAPRMGQLSTVIKNYEKRKNDYKMVGQNIVVSRKILVPCIYSPNSTISNINNTEAQYPFQTQCSMSKRFIESKNLQVMAFSEMPDPSSKAENYYIIYKNMLRLKNKMKEK